MGLCLQAAASHGNAKSAAAAANTQRSLNIAGPRTALAAEAGPAAGCAAPLEPVWLTGTWARPASAVMLPAPALPSELLLVMLRKLCFFAGVGALAPVAAAPAFLLSQFIGA